MLVGGEGTRLRPLTFTLPKQLLPIAGMPMIERVLSHLARHGVDEAVLSLGYLPDAFKAAYPSGMAAGVALSYAVEPELLDTAGAVRYAARHAGIDRTFVVVNGDVLTSLDVSALVAFHNARGAEATIALHAVDDPSAYGVVATADNGKVNAFVEKPPRGQAPSNLVNAGTYVLEPTVVDRIPSGRRVSIERETFPAMVADGTLYALADQSFWLDAGTPATYVAANLHWLEREPSEPPVPAAKELERGVWIVGSPDLGGDVSGSLVCEGARIAAGAVVDRSVVAATCEVQAGATVRCSVLMTGACIRHGAQVEGSVVGPGARLEPHCRVRGATIVGAGAVVEEGSVLDGTRAPA